MMQPVSYYYEIAEGYSINVNYSPFSKARQVVKDPLKDRKSYVCEHKSEGWSVMLAKASDRIWEENDQGIRIVKNRHTNDPTVDMKEFFWIKLSSREL